MKLNSSPGTTDWVCIRMCGFVHKRSRDAFVTSTSAHHNCGLILSHFTTFRLTKVTAPPAEITRVTRTLTVVANIKKGSHIFPFL